MEMDLRDRRPAVWSPMFPTHSTAPRGSPFISPPLGGCCWRSTIPWASGVRTLVNEVQPAGFYEALWNARDQEGSAVAAGVYLARLALSRRCADTAALLPQVICLFRHLGGSLWLRRLGQRRPTMLHPIYTRKIAASLLAIACLTIVWAGTGYGQAPVEEGKNLLDAGGVGNSSVQPGRLRS